MGTSINVVVSDLNYHLESQIRNYGETCYLGSCFLVSKREINALLFSVVFTFNVGFSLGSLHI